MFYTHKKSFIRTLLRCLSGAAVVCTLLYATVSVLTKEANAKVCFLPGGKCPGDTTQGNIRAIQGNQCLGYNLTQIKCKDQACEEGWICESCTNAQGTYYKCREVETPEGFTKGIKECKTSCEAYAHEGFTGNSINGKCTPIKDYVKDNPGHCFSYLTPDYVYGVNISGNTVEELPRHDCYYNIQSIGEYYTDNKGEHFPEIFDLEEKKGSDGKTCYRAKGCNTSAGWSTSSPDEDIFNVEHKTIDGITCHKAVSCNSGSQWFDNNTLGKYSNIYVSTTSATSSNLTCYKATGCYSKAYSNKPDAKFFKSQKFDEAYSNGHDCWIITGKADYAYDANDVKSSFFSYENSGNQNQYDDNEKKFNTVKYYVAKDCAQYAYSSQPDAKYFSYTPEAQYNNGSSTEKVCYNIIGKGSYAYTNEEKIGTHFAYDTGAEGYLNGTSNKVKYYNVTGCATYAYTAEPAATCYSSDKLTRKKGGVNSNIDCWNVIGKGVYAYEANERETKYFSYSACDAKYLNGTSSQGTFYTMSECGQYAYDAVPDAKYFASNSKSNYLNGKSNQKTCWNITGKGSYAYTEAEKKTKYFAYDNGSEGYLNGTSGKVKYFNITGCAANAYSEETDKTYFAYNNEKGKKNGVNADITCYNATGCTGEAKLVSQRDLTHFKYSDKKRHFNGADAETSCYLASGCSEASVLTGTQNTTMYVYDNGATSNGYTCYKINSCNKGYKQAVANNAYGLTCTVCGKGEYNATAGATSCEKCGAGTASNTEGATSAETCTQCAAGTYAAQGAATCSTCAAGTKSGAGAESCTTCGKGTWSGAGASECTKCAAGTASDTEGATSAATCKQCAAGTYSGAGASGCTKCAAGKTSAAGAATCEDCAAGWYSNKEGSASCEKCPAGQYSNAKGSTSCTKCPAGKYNTGTGNTSCTECPAGKYNTGTGNTSCTNCGKGTYASGKGNTECKDCIAGKYADSEGSSACELCDKGTYSGAKAETCTKCGKGTYSTTIGAQSESTCTKCPAGTYSDTEGANSADACSCCAKNTYSADGASACTPCPAGKWSSSCSSSCTDCTITYSTSDLWYVEGTTPSGCYIRAGGTDSVSCGGKTYYKYKLVNSGCVTAANRTDCYKYTTVVAADGVTYYYSPTIIATGATTVKPSVTNTNCHTFSSGNPSANNGTSTTCYWNDTNVTSSKPADSETENCTLTQDCTDSSVCTDTSTSCTDSSACTATSQYCNCDGTQTRTGSRTGKKYRTGFKNGTQSRTGSHTRTRTVTCNNNGTGYSTGTWNDYGTCTAPTSTPWGACNVSGECIYTDWGSCGNYGDCEYTSWGDCSSTGCNIANNDYCEEHVCRPGNCRTVSAEDGTILYSNASKCTNGYTNKGLCGEDDTCIICDDGTETRTADGVKCNTCDSSFNLTVEPDPNTSNSSHCYDGTDHYRLDSCKDNYKKVGNECVLKECTDYNKDYVTSCVSHPCGGGDFVTCEEYKPRTGLKCYIRTSTLCSCVQGTAGEHWVYVSDKDKCTKGYTNNGICGQDDACIVCNNGISAANSNVDADGQYYISKLDGVNCNPCDSSFNLTVEPDPNTSNSSHCYDGTDHYKLDSCKEGYYKYDNTCKACTWNNYTLTNCPSNCTCHESKCGGTTKYSIYYANYGYIVSDNTCVEDPCDGYTLDSCPTNGNCSECQKGPNRKYKLTGCPPHQKLVDGECVWMGCKDYDKKYVDSCMNTICSENGAPFTSCTLIHPRPGLDCYIKFLGICSCSWVYSPSTVLYDANSSCTAGYEDPDVCGVDNDCLVCNNGNTSVNEFEDNDGTGFIDYEDMVVCNDCNTTTYPIPDKCPDHCICDEPCRDGAYGTTKHYKITGAESGYVQSGNTCVEACTWDGYTENSCPNNCNCYESTCGGVTKYSAPYSAKSGYTKCSDNTCKSNTGTSSNKPEEVEDCGCGGIRTRSVTWNACSQKWITGSWSTCNEGCDSGSGSGSGEDSISECAKGSCLANSLTPIDINGPGGSEAYLNVTYKCTVEVPANSRCVISGSGHIIYVNVYNGHMQTELPCTHSDTKFKNDYNEKQNIEGNLTCRTRDIASPASQWELTKSGNVFDWGQW